ncbi:hypothetical protein I5Q34_12150 [Streptomyces sp. AV19]|uniref:hypothetical protein n=1 Tax=Streptomyces sp. AV19 TaxID=2793068 RepID=UPI0018FE1A24|nr:hypothetical protein [Streptomyces sp. AV19]MBH1935019.1 hypothetical protein [Streptomyces sp. AV19]MDG4530952.1 hypothetical protein [Streptomyces sp. AV19]
MQRRAYAPAAALAAAVLAAGLTGCGGSSGATGGDDDPKPGTGGSTAPAAEPGKYHSLPEPCGYVGRDTLRRLLPGAGEDAGGSSGESSGQDADKAYKGQATLTYDADRRVGCRWKTPDDTRHLSVDFERVVSYQAGVSDEDRAQQLYKERAAAAHIPVSSPDASGSSTAPSSSTPSGTKPGAKDAKDKSKKNDPKTTDASSRPAATASPSAPAPPSGGPELGSRVLDDVGDDAYVHDKLVSGGTDVHRDVTIVFRSANVLVTIAYSQGSADRRHVPGSQDLQGKAHGLAREVDAGHFGN